jgi:TonB family protein
MKPLFAGMMIAAALLAGGAASKPEPSPLAQRPTPEQETAALPPEVVAKGLSGTAAAMCKVTPDGGLDRCRTVLEYPATAGFGKALTSLAPLYRMKPPTAGGLPPGSDYMIAIDRLRYDKLADWLRKPTQSELLGVWPTAARAKGIDGAATVLCLVSTRGALFDCLVRSESPAGMHFGDAGLALTQQFLMKPATLKGEPVVSVVLVPLNFHAHGAVPASFGSRQVVRPVMAWPEAPTYAEVAGAYPAKARAARIGGRATMNCSFGKDGKLTACETALEEPKGQGFGAAAKTLAKRFRADPTDKDGKSIAGAVVVVPFAFDPSMLSAGEPVVGKPNWVAIPTVDQIIEALGKTDRPGTSRVVIKCIVQAGGAVSDCSVESESPAGAGLGQAALTLAPTFRLSTWTDEGLPIVGGTVRIPLRYEGGEAKAVAAKP